MNSVRRVAAFALVVTANAAAWYGMMIAHESGHVLAARASGGRAARVILHPLAFSRTDLAENPHPLFVSWSGPVWGSVLPVAVWLVARRWRLAFLLRYFAGFCLIANGVYLASVAVLPVGDAEDLLRLGAPLWVLAMSGVAAFAGGLALWNGLGAEFGFGGREPDRAAVVVATGALVVLVVGMCMWSWLR